MHSKYHPPPPSLLSWNNPTYPFNTYFISIHPRATEPRIKCLFGWISFHLVVGCAVIESLWSSTNTRQAWLLSEGFIADAFSFFFFLAGVYLTQWHPRSPTRTLRAVLIGTISGRSLRHGNIVPSSRFNSRPVIQRLSKSRHKTFKEVITGSDCLLWEKKLSTLFIYLCIPCMTGRFSHNSTDNFLFLPLGLLLPLWCPCLSPCCFWLYLVSSFSLFFPNPNPPPPPTPLLHSCLLRVSVNRYFPLIDLPH